MEKRPVAVTGAAGFIGYHLTRQLAHNGFPISWAVDSLKPSYGGALSNVRYELLKSIVPVEMNDLLDLSITSIAERLSGTNTLVHLAASPGVRSGEQDPFVTYQRNATTFQRVLSAAETCGVERVFYASSSSVYGDAGVSHPCAEDDATGTDLKSWYATTKWINELQARDFTRRTGIQTVGLRFFTVFGSFGRPDMAYFHFANSLAEGQPVYLYGKTGGIRDYTHVSDTVNAIVSIIQRAHLVSAGRIPATINIATGRPVSTLDMLNLLATKIGVENPIIRHRFRPSVDAEATHADIRRLIRTIGEWRPTSLAAGLQEFVDWWVAYRREYSTPT